MFEKRPEVAVRISVTDRCQLRCSYCRLPDAVPRVPRAQVLSFEEITGFVRRVKSSFGLSKVRITGGEPLLRPGIVDLVGMLAREGVPDLALTTNGQRLAKLALDLRSAGLVRVNVSLDTLNAETYHTLSAGGCLDRTLLGIETARLCGLTPVKVNVVVLRGVNDHEVADLARFGLERGVQVRFLEVMPIGAAAAHFDEWFVSSAEVMERLEPAFNLRPLPRSPGASSRDFLARDARGRTGVLGLISPCSNPFCEDCRRVRLTSTGRLLGCLAQADGIHIRSLLGTCGAPGERQLVEAMEKAFRLKRNGRRFVDQHAMVRIGG